MIRFYEISALINLVTALLFSYILLKNKTNISNNNQVINREEQENKDESVDVDTPTNIENEDIDSYVNPVPSVDQDD